MTTLTAGASLSVFHIVERQGRDSVWVNAGVASVNKDGSCNVLLFGLPTGGKLHIRLPQGENKRETTGGAFLPDTQPRDRLAAYNVREGKGDETYWNRMGSAFVNGDGSLSVLLDLLPLDGKLCIRKPKAEEKSSETPA